MLLIGAPVMIDDPVARHFLEQAQDLGAELTLTLEWTHSSTGGAPVPGDRRLDDAMEQLQSAAAPLLQPLKPEVRDSIVRRTQN